jgi:arylsulfatase A-like enzyme
MAIAVALATAADGRAAGAGEPESQRPNILLILVDDMGFSDIGCYGSEIHTPNVDQLAAGGLRFMQFYNTARCCPTRASLMTGLYPHQAGVGHMTDKGDWSSKNWINEWYIGDLRPDAVTIAQVLKSAGYRTYMAGKWHVSKNIEKDEPKYNWPVQRGFDRYYGIIVGAANYFDPGHLARDNTLIKADSDPDYKPAQYYFTDALGDHAVRFLAEHQKTAQQPFFLYLAFTAPHWPMQAPESVIAKYKGRYDAGYEPIRLARFQRQQEMGLIQKDWDLSRQFGNWDKVQRKDWEARCMEVYAALVDRMDQNVGKVLAELRRQNQLNNTLILFLSDNGGCAENMGRGPKAPMPGPKESFISYGEAWANVSNTPFRYYKHYVHEGGISTPLIAHWPGVVTRPGQFESQPGHLIDIMATCVDVARATYPTELNGRKIQPMEGVSLAPALRGGPLGRKNPLFWEHEGNRALRQGNWKLVAKDPTGPWELYDMTKDRTEMHDLAGQHPEKVKEMAALWEQWAKRTHAIPWPWGKPYGIEKPVAEKAKAKPAKRPVK